jgi:hypothetical protein
MRSKDDYKRHWAKVSVELSRNDTRGGLLGQSISPLKRSKQEFQGELHDARIVGGVGGQECA